MQPTASNLFDLWQTIPAADAAGMAFDADAPAANVQQWLLPLQGTPEDWSAALTERARRIDRAESRLEQLAAQDPAALLALRASLTPGAGEIAFDPATGAFDYSALDVPAVWADAQAWFARLSGLVAALQQQVSQFAWVDTTLEGRLAARSILTWGGDLTTTWQSGLPAQVIDTHQQSLALAIRSRAAQVHSVLLAARLAVQISLAAAAPLGMLQALALAWKMINEGDPHGK